VVFARHSPSSTRYVGQEEVDEPATIEREALRQTLAAERVPAATITAVEEALDTRAPYVHWEELIPIGLIAGFAGAAVLRTARSRLLAAIGAVAFEARQAGIREGANISASAAAQTARDPRVADVEPEAAPVLTQAITVRWKNISRSYRRAAPMGLLSSCR
jgi:hypothetical protein